MAQYFYEGMFLFDSGRYGRDAEAVSSLAPTIIRNAGGEVLVSRLWEERRLAYPIKGQRKGTYWLTYFKIDGDKMDQIRRQCRLAEPILRTLFIRIDPRIIDALVEHAKVGPAAPSAAPRSDRPERRRAGDAVVDPEEIEAATAMVEET